MQGFILRLILFPYPMVESRQSHPHQQLRLMPLHGWGPGTVQP